MKTYPMCDTPLVYYGVNAYRGDDPAHSLDAPHGIEIAIQEADCSEAVLRPEMPWEEGYFHHFNICREDGQYRLWYGAGRNAGRYCYAQSNDGYHWERPHLGLGEHGGSTENNLCVGPGFTIGS